MELDPKTDLSFTRTLPVPRRLVWECWTQVEHLPHFFMPRPHQIKNIDIDLRTGGRWNSTMVVDGHEIENMGVYLEVIAESRLVFTDAYSEGWKPAPDPFMTAILDLADAPGGGTVYTATARHRSAESCNTHREMGFFTGWGTVVDQLVEYIEAIKR